MLEGDERAEAQKLLKTRTLPALDSLVATSRQVVELETHRAEQGAGRRCPLTAGQTMLALGGASLLISVLLAWRITRSIIAALEAGAAVGGWPPGIAHLAGRGAGQTCPVAAGWRACRAACAR